MRFFVLCKAYFHLTDKSVNEKNKKKEPNINCTNN